MKTRTTLLVVSTLVGALFAVVPVAAFSASEGDLSWCSPTGAESVCWYADIDECYLETEVESRLVEDETCWAEA